MNKQSCCLLSGYVHVEGNDAITFSVNRETPPLYDKHEVCAAVVHQSLLDDCSSFFMERDSFVIFI